MVADKNHIIAEINQIQLFSVIMCFILVDMQIKIYTHTLSSLYWLFPLELSYIIEMEPYHNFNLILENQPNYLLLRICYDTFESCYDTFVILKLGSQWRSSLKRKLMNHNATRGRFWIPFRTDLRARVPTPLSQHQMIIKCTCCH